VRARLGIWALLGAAVVLGTRAIVYAVAPTQTALVEQLARRGGGPHVGILLAVIVAIGAALAAGVLWFAAVAVRERLALEERRILEPPRLRPNRLAARWLVLFAASLPAFAYFESYLHWRAGLGWHGLRCVYGPYHRNAIPVLAALSLLAVAVHGALEHLLGWVRRLVATLAARVPALRGLRLPAAVREVLPRRRAVAPTAPRGPPALFVSGL
jgi:hypothetical protein